MICLNNFLLFFCTFINFFSCTVSNKITQKDKYVNDNVDNLSENSKDENLNSIRFKLDVLNKKFSINKKKNYKIIEKQNDCKKVIDDFIFENKKKYINVFYLICYIGSSKKKSNEIIKNIYKKLDKNLHKISLRREYLNNYYRVTLGPFMSATEVLPYKIIFKDSMIVQTEVKNDYEKIKNSFFNKLRL